MTTRPQTLKTAARILISEAKVRFDSCKGADGSGFVCGSCDDVAKCWRDYREMVATAKALRTMARAAKPAPAKRSAK